MTEDRMNAPLLLFVHKDINIDIERIIDSYVTRHSRRMLFMKPLRIDPKYKDSCSIIAHTLCSNFWSVIHAPDIECIPVNPRWLGPTRWNHGVTQIEYVSFTE